MFRSFKGSSPAHKWLLWEFNDASWVKLDSISKWHLSEKVWRINIFVRTPPSAVYPEGNLQALSLALSQIWRHEDNRCVIVFYVELIYLNSWHVQGKLCLWHLMKYIRNKRIIPKLIILLFSPFLTVQIAM